MVADEADRQAENLICLNIARENGTKISMITEAGIIGKIGMNSHGVGCTLNAITAKGVAFDKIPVHLALRTVLEASSRNEAVEKLERLGVASAGHILVADATGGIGLECSSEDIVRLPMDSEGIVAHTNHYVLPHAKQVIEKTEWLPDTRFRLKRVGALLDSLKKEDVGDKVLWDIFEDEVEGDGASICRKSKEKSPLASLFGIVMDLGRKRAEVRVGRPVDPSEKVLLNF